MELIRGVEEVAVEAGASVVLTRSGTRHAPGPEWVDGVLRRRPLGVVLVFSALPAEPAREALVARHPVRDRRPGRRPGPRRPLGRLGQLAGRRRGHPAPDRPRAPAHRDRHRAAGHDVLRGAAGRVPVGDGDGRSRRRPRAWCASATSTSRAVTSTRPSLLDLRHPPTAIFAGSDLQALGAIEAARMRGLRIPEDLSVVGYDDIPVARWSSPALTTVHQPLQRMGQEAARLVLRLRDGDVSATRMDLAVDLVVRDSTAPPASAPA
nr:substrate-binding domain-containing protein [Angustibacter aerolatus]